ncbi:hypothetical protein C0991_001961 [Blastosporella zonata]|nr:hypothetical protein C0991_001961 [Blastosporella zonata]
MKTTTPPTGMFIHFDPNKIPLPPVLGGRGPQNELSPTPLPGSAPYGSKRKRINNSGASPPQTFSFEKAIERAAQNEINYAAEKDNQGEGIVSKDRLKTYDNREELMKGLGECFQESQTVNFAASYRAYDSGVSHKQRIQTITHDIWKTTGYRFTVKDHPHAKDGHKTRLWCSQDEAHKNKPSKSSHAPRLTSDGIVLAKARYPCRSGLLISSRDDSEPNVSHVVVRMHHHLAHEPYYDHTLPPEMTQSIWEKIPKGVNALGSPSSSASFIVQPPPSTLSVIASPEVFMEYDEPVQSGSGTHDNPDSNQIVPQSSQEGHQTSVENAVIEIPDVEEHDNRLPQSPSRNPEIFQKRMRKHISNIRDFCHGLEYQLQFNDFQLLEVLESEGSQFFKLVNHCLEMEGRLRTPDGQREGSTSGTTTPQPN